MHNLDKIKIHTLVQHIVHSLFACYFTPFKNRIFSNTDLAFKLLFSHVIFYNLHKNMFTEVISPPKKRESHHNIS